MEDTFLQAKGRGEEGRGKGEREEGGKGGSRKRGRGKGGRGIRCNLWRGSQEAGYHLKRRQIKLLIKNYKEAKMKFLELMNRKTMETF